MSWRLARSLDTLRGQVNAASPGRSKASDGTIGDAAHASRNSDHNPWIKDGGMGVVSALDITHDPANGVDIQKLADALVASKDSRIKYIIANGRIVSGSGQSHPAWQWRNYTGSNQHTKHVHISVKATKTEYDDTRPWALDRAIIAGTAPADAVLKKGSSGPFVEELQRNMNALGFGRLETDGKFGNKTETAVKAFQKSAGLAVDGFAGPRTLEAIGRALGKAAEARNTAPKVSAAQEEVKEVAGAEVKQKTNWLVSLFGAGGVGSAAVAFIRDADWQTIALIGGAGIVGGVVILAGGTWIVRRIKDIGNEWRT